MKNRLIISMLLVCLITITAVPATQAISLKDILKVGGIGFLVDKFAKPLNDFINTLTFKHGGSHDYATKVVPILSFGNGSHIGAAQVIGERSLVDRTEAVIQLEDDFSGNRFRVKALIPIDSKNPINFSRVQGVGVSAIIDVKI
ncbi:hypothetical protein [Dendrosporobacter sp. 1207_IL3150]|uniref:hypothetical protein n=1 Tax=Dendrosporobacter sp. 1207_IL3150 TaxID=3084054 RepID=UPI002FD92D31